MSFNLEFILVVATALTGAVVLVHRLATRNAGDEAPAADAGPVVEFSRSFFPVLLVVLVIRSFLFEPYKIPSGSMMPTLLIGDFIFVSKFSYGIRLPVLQTKIVATGEPKRGDVVVFRGTQDQGITFIKRVVGLPGDQILYRNGNLTINGEPVPLSEIGPLSIDGEVGTLYEETLDGRGHAVLHRAKRLSAEAGTIVPDDCYFVMGDNRENSNDSRFRSMGCVPERNLVGRAGRIWLNFRWGESPRWNRIGDKIQ